MEIFPFCCRSAWSFALRFSAKLHRLGSEHAPNRQSAITWTCKCNFALKALFLSLDRNVTMLECNAISTLFAQYICLHGYIHFIYLFNPNTKYRDMYRIPQISQKIPRYEFMLILPALLWRNVHFGNILLEAPSCGIREAKSFFFFLTEFMPFKFECNLNFDNIFVKILNFVFHSIWQP